MKKNGNVVATFVYDGDGKRVKATVDGVTTVYVGDQYEKQGSVVRKYYSIGGQRVAMRVGSTVYLLLNDHLGSTAVTANGSGVKVAELRYKAWGETRYTWGSTPTTFRFTGQRLDGYIDLYFMGARQYDPQLSRWISPDILVPSPSNPQSLNRLSYAQDNPLKFVDRTGFCLGTADAHDPGQNECWGWIAQIEATYSNICVDPVSWTASELAIVFHSLGAHVFREEILSASRVRLLRREGESRGPAGTHLFEGGTHTVTIFDRAYYVTPDANRWETERFSLNFQGAVVHELTHVATSENPRILESYRDAQPLFATQPVGRAYGWARCGLSTYCKYSEGVAIAASAYYLTPDVFKWKFLVWEGTNWQAAWIQQFRGPPGPGELTISAGGGSN